MHTRRALISVSDKSGIVELARELREMEFELLSTGGTAALLRKEGLEVREVSDLTGFPECLDGRVKTLHPVIHAGLLANMDLESHRATLKEMKIDKIDLVVVNLYPFRETVKRGASLPELIEQIDIGGPAMLRSAAKNYRHTVVMTDPADYASVLGEWKREGDVSEETRFVLMRKVFSHTASYDAFISETLRSMPPREVFPKELTLPFLKKADLRYGENAHQKAAFYEVPLTENSDMTNMEQLSGKELSYNNLNDANGAFLLAKEFTEPVVVASKHGNPCGVGSAGTLEEAWEKAYTADPVSIFGGIIAVNREVTAALAEKMKPVFLEVLLAPSYTEEALEVLRSKKNLRVLRTPGLSEPLPEGSMDFKKISGGLIYQEADTTLLDGELTLVTDCAPDEDLMDELLFAFRIVKHVKSNAIVLTKDKRTIGIGPGQVNRIWSLKQCVDHAGELISEDITRGCILASDAFFPFSDCVEEAYKAGVRAIIQPGGSIRDQESIDKANELKIPMFFTGIRHFRH